MWLCAWYCCGYTRALDTFLYYRPCSLQRLASSVYRRLPSASRKWHVHRSCIPQTVAQCQLLWKEVRNLYCPKGTNQLNKTFRYVGWGTLHQNTCLMTTSPETIATVSVGKRSCLHVRVHCATVAATVRAK
eukprot:5923112-Amphidinium_carterae.1